jgi:hypothetical protein
MFNKNKPKQLPISIPQNVIDNHITQSLLTHLEMQTNGALMLTGE